MIQTGDARARTVAWGNRNDPLLRLLRSLTVRLTGTVRSGGRSGGSFTGTGVIVRVDNAVTHVVTAKHNLHVAATGTGTAPGDLADLFRRNIRVESATTPVVTSEIASVRLVDGDPENQGYDVAVLRLTSQALPPPLEQAPGLVVLSSEGSLLRSRSHPGPHGRQPVPRWSRQSSAAEVGMGTAAGHLPEDHYSFEDYLALEERSELRHELVGGRVILMSGGTRAHDQATFYLAQRLSDAYSKPGCAVFPHNRKLVIDGNAYYPDAFVHCGPAGHDLYEVDAVVVVEVLSPSSALRDRREKAAAYVRLPSLRAYVVVDPDQPRVEVYQPEDGAWTWRVYGPGMIVTIDQLQLDVDQLYDWIAERT